MEIVKGERAILLEDSRTLVVSDLHIGFEVELMKNGIFVPPQGPLFAEQISAIAERTKAKRLVLLGDVKHAFTDPTYAEEDRVVDFLKRLVGTGLKIEIIPGNHDGDLKNVLPAKVKMHPADGAIIGDTGLFHGHAWPSARLLECRNLLISHIHPTVAFVDSMGAFHKEPCFITCRLLPEQIRFNFPGKKFNREARVLVMPAWNGLLGGGVVQEMRFDTGFWKCLDLESSQVFLTDGTLLGKIGDLQRR
jgi:putative SbcD/Mre11-related phosphoesterase